MKLLLFWLVQLVKNDVRLLLRQHALLARLKQLEEEVKALREQRPN